MTFTIHASELSPGHITVNIETSLTLDANELRSALRRIGGIRIVSVLRDGNQWTVKIAHQEINPHPLNVRIWNLLEQAYAR
jgi:hypothetical protein